jgi:hypothetical protein
MLQRCGQPLRLGNLASRRSTPMSCRPARRRANLGKRITRAVLTENMELPIGKRAPEFSVSSSSTTVSFVVHFMPCFQDFEDFQRHNELSQGFFKLLQLLDASTGKNVDLFEFSRGAPATLVMFLSNHCPFVKHLKGKPYLFTHYTAVRER